MHSDTEGVNLKEEKGAKGVGKEKEEKHFWNYDKRLEKHRKKQKLKTEEGKENKM